MKIIVSYLILFLLLLGGTAGHAQPQVDIGATFGPEGSGSFYFSIHEYFRVPEREVVVIRERRIPDEEIPVVFFVAQRARVAPAVIIDLRLAGRSWMDITVHFVLNPEIYYVPVPVEVKGPPYGKAYGYYKNKPRKEWGKIVLKDPDVINFVNLKFISEYHSYPPEEVIKMRSANKHFIVINDEVRKGKGKKEHLGEQGKGKEKEHGEGQGKEKGKDKGKGKD